MIMFAVMLLSIPVILAQDTADGDGIIEAGENPQEELAKAAQNPVADLISLPFRTTPTSVTGPTTISRMGSTSNRRFPFI
jgi:hypothetical protein